MGKFASKNTFDVLTGQDPAPAEEVRKAVKRKPGRPKKHTEPTKTINIAIPEHVYEKMQRAKCCYNGNLTQYINSLIARDLDANYDTLYSDVYRKIMNL